MKFKLNKSMLAIVVSGLLGAPLAQATNGYFMYGYSTKEKGLAGAGAALSQDALASATNPAGMAFVGNRMDLGVQLFSPSSRSYEASGSATRFFAPPNFTFGIGDGGQKIESENDLFLIPHFGYNTMLDSKSALGVSIYGNGGMNTEYKGGFAAVGPGNLPGTYGSGTIGVNLEQLFINTSYAYKLNNKSSVGASIIFVAQRFSARGLEFFGGFSTDPDNLSGNRNSYSYGAGFKLGYQGEVADGVRLGVSYQTEMSMGEFDEYSGLFAEGGGFDIPSTYTLGFSYDIGNSGTFVFDYQRINYSDVASISNKFGLLTNGNCVPAGAAGNAVAFGSTCFGGSDGAGFGWQDMDIYKFGYQWSAANMIMRVGYSHASDPFPGSEVLFNILAPAVVTQQFSFGLTKEIGTDQEFNLSVGYAPSEDITGPNAFDPPNAGGTGQTIKLEMEQFDLQVGYAWKY